MKQKIRLLLLPFLILAIGFIALYGSLYWLLFVKNSVINADEELVNFWLPFLLPWIPVLIWLRPRIKLLKLKRGGTRSPDFAYMMIAALGIGAPAMIAMPYVESATGKLTTLSSINDIRNNQPTKYYALKNFYVDKLDKSIAYTADVSGRYNDELNLHIYIACPLYENDGVFKNNEITKIAPRIADADTTKNISSDSNKAALQQELIVVDGEIKTREYLKSIPPETVENVTVLKGKSATALFGNQAAKGAILVTTKKKSVVDEEVKMPQPKAWLCIKYDKTISNHLSASEKGNIENSFSEESRQAFGVSNLNTFSYLERIGNNASRRGYQKAIDKSQFSDSTAIILEPAYGNFSRRNGNKLAWIFGALGIAAFVWMVMILIPKLDEEKSNALHSDAPQSNTLAIKSSYKTYTGFFVPRPGYFITPILIDINILVFVLMVVSGLGFLSFDANDLLHWGANYKPYTDNGEWWRLITAMFVHGGFIHLFSNMYALLFAGILLEPLMERNTYALCYLITGVLANATSSWWHTATVSVGASGAIFGLYGILLALLLAKVVSKDFSKTFLTSIIIFIAYNLVLGFANEIVDNAAHVGGLISGVVIGLLIIPSVKRKIQQGENIL